MVKFKNVGFFSMNLKWLNIIHVFVDRCVPCLLAFVNVDIPLKFCGLRTCSDFYPFLIGRGAREMRQTSRKKRKKVANPDFV